MYKLSKPNGYGGIVTVENTERNTRISLGSATDFELINLLKEELGVETTATDPDHGLDLFKEWNIEIDKDVAKNLCNYTFRIRRPKLSKTKAKIAQVATEQPKPEAVQPKKQIDALDVLLGLASY